MNPLALLGPIISSVGDYFTSRQQIKAAKVERKDELKKLDLESKLESIKRGEELDMKLDGDSRNSAGLMDDISFYIFLAPAVLAFFPGMVDHVVAGFKALEQVPMWYQYALGMMLVSVWGYRKLVTPLIQLIVSSYIGKPK